MRISIQAIKADGHVDQRELDSLKSFFRQQLRYQGHQMEWVEDLIQTSLKQSYSLVDLCEEFQQRFSGEPCYVLLDMVYRIISIDNVITKSEQAIADQIAKHADFISFGTNDLTQTTFGFSRDDVGSFFPYYIKNNIIKKDPFVSIDKQGVGELIKIAVKRARKINKKIKIGVCGEHGGDPQSIKFFNELNFNYVSCSPFRLPIAYLASAKNDC